MTRVATYHVSLRDFSAVMPIAHYADFAGREVQLLTTQSARRSLFGSAISAYVSAEVQQRSADSLFAHTPLAFSEHILHRHAFLLNAIIVDITGRLQGRAFLHFCSYQRRNIGISRIFTMLPTYAPTFFTCYAILLPLLPLLFTPFYYHAARDIPLIYMSHMNIHHPRPYCTYTQNYSIYIHRCFFHPHADTVV
jgi:hypothetical protein